MATRTGNQEALLVLVEAPGPCRAILAKLAIGFLVESYRYLGRPLPPSVIERLRFLVQNDVSAEVRVEAVMALASLGLAEEATVAAIYEQTDQENKT